MMTILHSVDTALEISIMTVPSVVAGSPWILSAFLDDAHPEGKGSPTPL